MPTQTFIFFSETFSGFQTPICGLLIFHSWGTEWSVAVWRRHLLKTLINIISYQLRKLGKFALSYLDTFIHWRGLHTPRAEPNSVAVGTTGEGFSPTTASLSPGYIDYSVNKPVNRQGIQIQIICTRVQSYTHLYPWFCCLLRRVACRRRTE